jgi:predicted metal-dependent hydrolase
MIFLMMPTIITKWQERLDVVVDHWHVRKMKTKWGSCNIDKKSIMINLELAKKPERCLEYIIVHEMIHILERHHNDRFLYYTNTYLSNWKQLKAELNRLPVSHVEWKY